MLSLAPTIRGVWFGTLSQKVETDSPDWPFNTFRGLSFLYICGMGMNRQILRLAVPAIVSNVTVPLLGLSDTAISGHLGSEVYMAAISVGSMMIALTFGVLNFLRMGTSGMTAVAYGRGDTQGVREVFTGSLFFAVVLGVAIIVFQRPLLDVLMYVVGPDNEVGELASSYFKISVAGMPASLGTMVVSGWFIGMQSTLWPMVIAITTNLLNVGVSVVMVFVLDMGFKGVAYGTLTANCFGLVLALVLASRMAPAGGLWCYWRQVMRVDLFKRFFSVNSNIFVRSLCVMSVTLTVSALGARLGSMTLATNAVIVQFFIFFSYFMDGFAFTGEALCGRYYGEGDSEVLRSAVRHLLVWSAGIAGVFMAVYSVGWESVTSLLTDNDGVRESVGQYHRWIELIPAASVAAFIYDGFFIGVTRTRPMLVATSIAVGVFFAMTLPWVHGDGMAVGFSNDVIWRAFLVYLFVRGVILAVVWHRHVVSGVNKSNKSNKSKSLFKNET